MKMLAGGNSAENFVKADTRNLPKLRNVTILENIASNDKHNIIAEIRGAKMLIPIPKTMSTLSIEHVIAQLRYSGAIARAAILVAPVARLRTHAAPRHTAMSEVHTLSTDALIRAVKARPALYNKADARYNSHNKYKSKIWKEVCREVFPNWDQLRPSQKVDHDLELQKRWKSLRTCFTRELALQKKEQRRKEDPDEDMNPFKRRKKYEHFDALSFLLNPEDVDVTITDDGHQEDSEDNSSDPLEREIKIENLFYPQAGKNRRISQIEPEERPEDQHYAIYERPQYENNSRVVEEKILDLLKEKKKEDEDEDRQFMLSLVPGFKKLNDRQKFEARIEILKVLRNVTYDENIGNNG